MGGWTGTARGTLVGVAAILLWAALALFTVAARGLPPFELLSLSFGTACAAGSALLAARGRLRDLRQPPAPWCLAFAGLFLYHALYFYALSAAPPARASLVAYLWPLLIVLFSAALPGGRLLARHVAGAALGLVGTAAIVLGRGGGVGTVGAAPALGYAAAFGCALVWSGYSVLNRRFAAVPSAMLVGVCGAVALAGGVCHALFEETAAPDAGQGAAVLLLGLGPTGLAFLAWDHATKHGDLAVLGALSYLAPLISTLLLILAGRAEGGAALVAAAALVIGGAALATGLPLRRSRR